MVVVGTKCDTLNAHNGTRAFTSVEWSRRSSQLTTLSIGIDPFHNSLSYGETNVHSVTGSRVVHASNIPDDSEKQQSNSIECCGLLQHPRNEWMFLFWWVRNTTSALAVLLTIMSTSLAILSNHHETNNVRHRQPMDSRRTQFSSSHLRGSIVNDGVSPRIINGRKVDNSLERFPYFVSLLDTNDLHICGGTLIAPDIVLTAAHCSIGGLTTALIGGSMDYRVPIVSEHTHPEFIREEFSLDQMILKLEYSANNPNNSNLTATTVRINLDDTFPEESILYDNVSGIEIQIIGFGQTYTIEELLDNPSVRWNFPEELQQTTVDFVSNEECLEYQQESIDYGTLITADMICGWRNNTGQCHGDSGGPYLLLKDDDDSDNNPDPSQDIQIGIVSFGVGCANEDFPSVASRTSATLWIRHATCMESNDPPDYFDCDFFHTDTPSLAPTSPTISPQPSVQQVPLRLTIRMDSFPDETGWELFRDDDTGTILYDSRPAGTYNLSQQPVQETMFVHHGANYTLRITDSKDNGISRWGNNVYEVQTLVRHGEFYATLVQGDGHFTRSAEQTFYVPKTGEDEAFEALQRPKVIEGTVTVYLNLTFDSWPLETGWSIVDSSNHSIVFASAAPGTYRDGRTIMETIDLPVLTEKEGEFSLLVEDEYGDGILEGGKYTLWVSLRTKTVETNKKISSLLLNTGAAKAKAEPPILVLVEGRGDDYDNIAIHNFTVPR